MGQLWHGASRMMTMQENVLRVPIKHYTIDFVAYTKKLEAKSRGRRGDLLRRRKENKKETRCYRGHSIQACVK